MRLRTIVPVVALSVMLVLAGCSALGSDDGTAPGTRPDGTDTPIGGDVDPTATTTESDDPSIEPARGAFPAGTSQQGIDDPVALIAQHLGVLSESSYTVARFEAHTTADYTYSMESTLAVQGGKQRLRVDYTGQAQDIYRADNASPSYIRWESANGSRYLRDDGDVLFPGESAFFTQSVLEAATFEFVEGRHVDDTDVFVFSITGFHRTPELREATPLEAVNYLRGTLAIRGDGVILDLDIELTGPDFNGQETTLQIGETVSEFGTTTVTEPDWLPEALDRAAVMAAELAPGREYIAISMEHGDPIPPGSTGYLYVGDIALEAPFEAGLATGQSFYLYESSGGELTVSMTPPGAAVEAPVPDGLGEVSVAIYNADYGTVFASTLPVTEAGGQP